MTTLVAVDVGGGVAQHGGAGDGGNEESQRRDGEAERQKAGPAMGLQNCFIGV